mgnify:FL=1
MFEFPKEAVCGLMAGGSQVIVGHPFDTVKVLLQTGKYSGVLTCLRGQTIFSLYNGVLSPLLGVGVCNSVLFHSFASFKDLTGNNVLLSGALAAVPTALVNCPVELVKIRLQTSPLLYKHFFDCLFRTLKQQNGFRELYKGTFITVLRDMPSYAAYFYAYDLGKSMTKEWGIAGTITCGAVAGIAAWLPCYPQDVIKSVIQCESTRSVNIQGAIRMIYRKHGLRGFFKGFTPTMARAVPANAITFLAYETAHKYL